MGWWAGHPARWKPPISPSGPGHPARWKPRSHHRGRGIPRDGSRDLTIEAGASRAMEAALLTIEAGASRAAGPPISPSGATFTFRGHFRAISRKSSWKVKLDTDGEIGRAGSQPDAALKMPSKTWGARSAPFSRRPPSATGERRRTPVRRCRSGRRMPIRAGAGRRSAARRSGGSSDAGSARARPPCGSASRDRAG